MSWDAPFDDPIRLPSGKVLLTLRDAGKYVSALPAKIHNQPKWQTAMAVLLASAEGGPTMLARIGMMQAISPPAEPANRSARKSNWRKASRSASSAS